MDTRTVQLTTSNFNVDEAIDDGAKADLHIVMSANGGAKSSVLERREEGESATPGAIPGAIPGLVRSAILCIGPTMDKDSKQVSGQAMMFQMLVDILAEMGNKVRVFSISESKGGKDKVSKERADGALGLRRVLDYFRVLPRVWASLVGGRSIRSLVYITTAQGIWGFMRDAAVIWPASLLGHRVVAQQFGANYTGFYNGQSAIVRRIIRQTLARTAAVIVEGDLTKQQFSFLPGWRHKVHSIPNGLPERSFAVPTVARTLDATRPFSILYLSNMVETKGYWDVLEAVRRLVNERGRNVRCYFVGKFLTATDSVRFPDPQAAQQAFLTYIQEHNLSGVIRYTETLLGQEKADAFEASDVFILPSNYVSEGQPVSVLEAMAHGLVVIATRYRLIPLMVDDGATGLFVEYNNPQLIADKIEYLIDHPDIYTKMSRNSLNKFNNEFRADRYVARVAQVFRGVERAKRGK